MASLDEAFPGYNYSSFRPKPNDFITKQEQLKSQQIKKYDYSTCPHCGSNKCIPLVNDGGSLASCNSCGKSFKSKIVYL